jgi:hypothetical protein
MLVAAAIAGLGPFFLNAQQFEAPLAVKGLLIAGFVVSIVTAMDLWTTRRRLEAAITLLELQQESDS